MKKTLSVLILMALTILIITINSSYAQNAWMPITTPQFDLVQDFCFINAQTGFIGGLNGRIAKTTNGGNTWINRQVSDSTLWITSISFINENTGWLCGYRSNSGDTTFQSKVYSTTNAGQSWNLVYQTLTSNFAYDVKMLGKDSIVIANSGYALGTTRGGLVSSLNGTTFQSRVNESRFQFSSLNFVNKNTGWVIASESGGTSVLRQRVYKTVNSGVNWNITYSDSIQPKRLKDIFFVNENTGYLCGERGLFAKTTNGGNNWVRADLSQQVNLNSLHFFNENTGYAAGQDSNSNSNPLKRTTDGGLTWVNMTNNTIMKIVITKVGFADEDNGWAIGSGYPANSYKMIRTITGGLTGIENPNSSTVKQFSLSQNYPNPFNPNTSINYEIPITNYVSIKIYDALGTEVETLVDEKQNAGSYSVNFNAASLPSGAYYYKLVTESFSETKKMVLVK